MKNTIILLTAFLSTTILFSQSGNNTVSGKVLDKSSGTPLEFATVSLTNSETAQLVNGGITDLDGNFALRVPSGIYDIKIEYISFKPITLSKRSITNDTQLPPISLEVDAASLDEVVIRAETTEVQVRLDKRIYNIGRDLTTRGATIGDALGNIPSVDVDIQGGISLRGNQNVTILINGRPSALAGFGDTDALTQLPAEAIDRVEVITSPSARYDAEGTAGIINIILKQDRILGFNGSVNISAGHPLNSGITVNANLRSSKFNIFNTTGYSYTDQPGNAFFDNTFENGDFSRTIEDRTFDRKRQGFNTNLGIEYFINNKSSITASGFLGIRNNDDETTAITRKFIGNTLAETSSRIQEELEKDYRYQFALNYINRFNDQGHNLTIDLQYENRSGEENGFIREFNTFGPNIAFPSEDITTIEDRNNYLFQADYVLPIGEDSQFEAGYRGNFRNAVTDYVLRSENLETGQFELDPNLTNEFDYTENIHAIYSQYGTKFGKFSFLLGLRLENTQLQGKVDSELSDEELVDLLIVDPNFDKDYLGLFPTVNLIYELGERESVTLGFNRRINRPRGWFINPFPSRASVTNIFQGNPDLDPAYASAFDLGYLKRWNKLTLTSSIYYQYETNSFDRVQIRREGETVNGIQVVRTIPINLSTNQRIGAEAGIIYNPQRWLRLNGSFNIFRFESEGAFEGIEYGTTNTSWFTRFSSRITLPGKVDWQTNMFYRGPSENAQTRSKGMLSLDLGFSKDIFNENATISLNVSDLLNTRKRMAFTQGNGFTSDSEFQWRSRQVTATFIYRFNQQKNQRDRRQRSMNGDGDFEGGEF
jgi:hypothetical protein